MASLYRLSFEYEVRILNITEIRKYNTGKNVPFMSYSDLDSRKIGLFLYTSIPFESLYRYQYVVQPDRLNYGIIYSCLRKGLCISRRDYEGTATGVEGEMTSSLREVF